METYDEDTKTTGLEYDDNPRYQSRFYENQFPEKDQVVMIRYKEVLEYGVKVELIEYNNIEGFIPGPELRQALKRLRVGNKDPAIITKLDKNGKYIDLSKIKLKFDDPEKCLDKYKHAKIVHTIIQRVAINCNIPLETLYKEIIWPLNKLPGQAFEAFKASDFSQMLKDNKIQMSEEVQGELMRQIMNKFTQSAIKIKARVKLACFTYEGMDAIKEALLAGIQEVGKSQEEIEFYAIAAPIYECAMQIKNKTKGIELINKALKKIEEVINAKGGSFLMIEDPKVYGEKDKEVDIEEEDKENPVSSEGENEEGYEICS